MNNGQVKIKFLTVKMISHKYGLEPNLVYYWVREKKFSYFKCDKKLLILETDLLDYLNSKKVEINE